MPRFKLILLALLIAGCTFCAEGLPKPGPSDQQQAKFLESVDEIMERGSCADFKEAQRLLLERLNEIGENSFLLWRLAKCSFSLKDVDCCNNFDDKKRFIEEGFKYAESALRCNQSDADAHKWFGIMSAETGNLKGIKDKIRGGYIFKKHLDRAIELKPEDSVLRFLNAVFLFELGKLSWVEKKMASTFFGTLPKTTIDVTLQEFLLAGKLRKKPWKMQCVYVAKCYQQLGNLTEAKKWLHSAMELEVQTNEDKKAEIEIASMRKSLKL